MVVSRYSVGTAWRALWNWVLRPVNTARMAEPLTSMEGSSRSGPG